MGKNIRKLTKVEHDKDLKVYLTNQNGKLESSDQSKQNFSDLINMYVKKHILVKEKVFKDKTTKFKQYEKNGDVFYLVEIHNLNIEKEYYMKINKDAHNDKNNYKSQYSYTKLLFQSNIQSGNKKKTKANLKLINKDELELLYNRSEFFREINSRFKLIHESFEINSDYEIKYSLDHIRKLASYIFNFEKKLTDQNGVPLKKLLDQSIIKGNYSAEIAAIIDKHISNKEFSTDEDIIKELKRILITRPNRIIKSFLGNQYIKSSTKVILLDKEYENEAIKYLNSFNIIEISEKLLNLENKTHSNLKNTLKDHYRLKWDELDEKDKYACYFYKHINRYIKGRITKYLRSETNSTSIFESQEMEAKLNNSLVNRKRYYKTYEKTLQYSGLDKQLSKANRTFLNKMITSATEVALNQLKLSEKDIFYHKKGCETFGDYVKRVHDEHTGENALDYSNYKKDAIIEFDDLHYLGAVLSIRNFSFHKIGDRSIKCFNDFFHFKDELFDKILKTLNNEALIDTLKSNQKDILKIEMNSNNIFKCYEENALKKIFTNIDYPISKPSILPRFNKIYEMMLRNQDIINIYNKNSKELNISSAKELFLEFYNNNYDNIPKIEGSKKYILNSLYKSNFYNWVNDKGIQTKECSFENLEKYKQHLIALSSGNEALVKEQERKFVKYVTDRFIEYLDDLKLLKEVFNATDYDDNVNVHTLCNGLVKDLKITYSDYKFSNKLSSTLLALSNLMSNRRLNLLINDLKKYQQFLMSFDNNKSQKVPVLIESEEMKNLIILLEAQLILKEKNLNNELVRNENKNDSKLHEMHFKILNINKEFKKPEDVFYKIDTIKQPVILANAKDEDERSIPYARIIEAYKFGYLDKEIENYCNILAETKNFNVKTYLKNYARLKNKIKQFQNEKSNLFAELKELYYKKAKDKSYKLSRKDKEEFQQKYQELLGNHKKILEYNFISNLLFLNNFNKVSAIVNDITARIIGYEVLIDEKKFPKAQNKKIYNSIRHLAHIKNLECKNESFTLEELLGLVKSEKSLSKDLEYLTNFRNDIRTVFVNLFKKNGYNIFFEDAGYRIEPRKHQIFNKENIKEVLDIDVQEDLFLIHPNEVKVIEKLLKYQF